MAQDTLTTPPGASVSAEGTISYQQFLDSEHISEHSEWVAGKVVPMSPVTKDHADLGVWLTALLRLFVEAHDLGRVLSEPFQMKTGRDLPGRAPDVLFIAKRRLSQLKRLYLEGPADLVVEIISPGSRGVDRGKKFHEYEQGGVEEYWLIDPARKQAEFYQRGQEGIYRLAPTASEDIYRSRVLSGLWLKVDWLWQQPLPPLLTILREWKLIP
jgi:Uma2 family endonuclease